MKASVFKLMPVAALLASLAMSAHAADSDADGVEDALDNCLGLANADQRDTDNDGSGNPCDGDLNNDGKVNSLDLGLFKKKLGSADLDADFNGDGVVNSLDAASLKQGMLKPPGPTAIKLDPALAANPPRVEAMDVAMLDAPLADGRNGAMFVRFAAGQEPAGGVLVIAPAGKPISLNDRGAAPDPVAGDRVFSAFIDIDKEDLMARDVALRDRVETLPAPAVTLFSGRDVVATKAFQPGATPSVFGDGASKLPEGMTRIPLAFLSSSLLPVTFDKSKVLLINDPGAVANPTLTFDPCNSSGTGNDANPDAAWSFKTLMANMSPNPANPAVVQQFIHDWLRNWMVNQTVNGFQVPARTTIQTLGLFPGWDGVNASTLNVNNLPFRLLAIVNRMDLGKSSPYGGGQAGETRFVFGLLQSCSFAPMTVIFEYGDTGASCTAQKVRANDWKALDALPIGSPAYLAALKALTDTVTLPGVAPSKVNGSALNQLRTNEIALTGFVWDFREFVLDSGTLNLRYDTLKQTPNRTAPASFDFNPSSTLDAYMQQNANAILCENYTVPLKVPPLMPLAGQDFRAGSIEYGLGAFWNWTFAATPSLPGSYPGCYGGSVPVTQIKSEVRHKFSLNTCDDCHAQETMTTFTHISPSTSLPAFLSGFLAGSPGTNPTASNWSVPDPAGSGVIRQFNDLERRGQILESIAAQSCLSISIGSFATQQSVLKMVH